MTIENSPRAAMAVPARTRPARADAETAGCRPAGGDLGPDGHDRQDGSAGTATSMSELGRICEGEEEEEGGREEVPQRADQVARPLLDRP